MAQENAHTGNANINPPRRAGTITPADGTDLGQETRALKIGATGGVVRVVMADETDASTTVDIPVQAYETLVIQVRRVYATGTTATTITGLY